VVPGPLGGRGENGDVVFERADNVAGEVALDVENLAASAHGESQGGGCRRGLPVEHVLVGDEGRCHHIAMLVTRNEAYTAARNCCHHRAEESGAEVNNIHAESGAAARDQTDVALVAGEVDDVILELHGEQSCAVELQWENVLKIIDLGLLLTSSMRICMLSESENESRRMLQ